MKKLDMLYEGKAKKVYTTDANDLYIVDYKDDATAFNGEKKGFIENKGIMNNKIANHLFRVIEENGVPTHFVQEISDRETIVKKVEIVPIEVIVRNIAAGSLAKRVGLPEGTVLNQPVLEYCYKNDALGDPMINEYHIYALKLATKEELDKMANMAFKINTVLVNYFKDIGITLVDFKIEFGRHKGKIILADEISPDTCRFWDIKTNEKLDKDRFRRDLGSVEQAYKEILKRLQEKS